MRMPGDAGHGLRRRSFGARSALVVPMVFRNRTIGFLTAFDRMDGRVVH